MKQLEEEFGPDRAIEIETDDEENEAERVCHDHENDNESDITGLSRVPSNDNLDPDPSPCWPQSYRYILHRPILEPFNLGLFWLFSRAFQIVSMLHNCSI